MTLWIILTIMAVVAAALLTVPLVRRQEARADARTATLAVLKDQLADVDVQLAAGAIPPGEAEGLRTEIRRRMLAAGHVPIERERPLGSRGLNRVAIGLAAAVGIAATAMYASMGRPDLGGIVPPTVTGAAAPAAAPGGDQAAEVTMLVSGLEKRMAKNPSDPEGWRMLGWSYFQTSRFDDSAKAYAKAVALKPDGVGYQSAYGEALVQAAGGVVTPAAQAVFIKAKALDSADARARFFLGLGKSQSGDARAAVDDWIALLGESAGDAPWVPQLRQAIEQTAAEAKIDVSARLAALKPPVSGGAGVAPPPSVEAPSAAMARGPSADQVAGAAAMQPGDQQAMIRGMVDRLAGKLKANPADEDGWVRLMRARMVLGDTAGAAGAKADALAAFRANAGATARLKSAADGLGIKG